MLEDYLYKIAPIYQSSPQLLKFIFGNIYHYIPNHLKFGRTYSHYRKLLNETEKWDQKKLNNYQFNKIKNIVEYAYNNVPFYQQYWKEFGFHPFKLKNLDDIKKIPFICKNDIRKNPKQFLSKRISKSKILEVSTGGSTGEPLSLFYCKGIQRPREQAFIEKQWGRIGYDARDSIAVLRSTVVERFGKRILWTYDPTRNRYIFSTFDLTKNNLPLILDQLRKAKPKFLHVYPSVLTIIANYIKLNNETSIEGLKGILSGSENTFPWQIALFQEVFKCKIFRWYGLSEMSALAGSCEKSFYYHCFPEYSYIELIGHNGEQVTDEGEIGEIVGTAFDNPAMPLIRYRTGDFAAKGPKKCSCGRQHFLLGEIQGREQEKIIAFDGSEISLGPVIFGIHHIFWTNIAQIQFVQIQKGELVVKIQPSDHRIDHEKLIDFIGKNIFFKLKGNFNLKIEFTDNFEKTPNGKHKLLVSYL